MIDKMNNLQLLVLNLASENLYLLNRLIAWGRITNIYLIKNWTLNKTKINLKMYKRIWDYIAIILMEKIKIYWTRLKNQLLKKFSKQ
jgi:hypothetical protein